MAPPGAWWFAPDGWVGINGTGGLRDQCRCGKERVPERLAATRRQDQFGNKAGKRRKAGGQAMREKESQAIARIVAG